MSVRNILILILSTSIIFASPLSARIINIPDDFETIQAGIDASEEEDTVLVQPGEYFENINFGGRGITVTGLYPFIGEEVYLDLTIINGGGNGSVVRPDQ